MGALNALQRSPAALTRNPVLVIPVLVVGLFQLPQLLLQAVDPLLSSLVSLVISGLFVFVMPFFQGGIIGMADEALEGRTRLGAFLADGKAHYVNLLVAYVLLLVVGFVLFIVFLAISFAGSILVLPHLEFSGFAVGLIGLFFLISYLPVFLFAFFIQFYGQAIVLDDEGSIDGIRRSVGLVRRNLLSTLAYSLVAAIFGGGLGLVLAGLSMLASPRSAQVFDLPELSASTLAAAILVVVVLASVVGSFLAVFSVAFYRDVSA